MAEVFHYFYFKLQKDVRKKTCKNGDLKSKKKISNLSLDYTLLEQPKRIKTSKDIIISNI